MTFTCVDGCGQCCGPVLFTKEEWAKHSKLLKQQIETDCIGDFVVPVTTKCPFLDDNCKCIIYEERPEVCRLFGFDERLPCPLFKPNGKKRSEASRKQVERMEGKKLDLFLAKARKELGLKQD